MILKKYKPTIIKILFTIYIILVAIITIIPTCKELKHSINFSDINYNLLPFKFLTKRIEILREMSSNGYNIKSDLLPNLKMIIKSFGYNIIMFIPMGFLLPILNKKYCNLKKVIIISMISSFCIEATQLFIMIITYTSDRVFDVDDIIANTIGGIIGLYIQILFTRIINIKWVKN